MVNAMKQKISECMDGELDAQSAARLLRELADSAEHRAEWTVYHTIGDGMRGAPDLSPEFARRFGERLAQEPTVLAPHRLTRERAGLMQIAMYAAASLAAVATVGWFAFSPQMVPGTPQLAQQTAPTLQATKAEKTAPVAPALSPLKPRDHDYLLAHQAVSPSGPMQGVAPYVRTVSFGTEPNAR